MTYFTITYTLNEGNHEGNSHTLLHGKIYLNQKMVPSSFYQIKYKLNVIIDNIRFRYVLIHLLTFTEPPKVCNKGKRLTQRRIPVRATMPRNARET